jgi:hypothetical protein
LATDLGGARLAGFGPDDAGELVERVESWCGWSFCIDTERSVGLDVDPGAVPGSREGDVEAVAGVGVGHKGVGGVDGASSGAGCGVVA